MIKGEVKVGGKSPDRVTYHAHKEGNQYIANQDNIAFTTKVKLEEIAYDQFITDELDEVFNDIDAILKEYIIAKLNIALKGAANDMSVELKDLKFQKSEVEIEDTHAVKYEWRIEDDPDSRLLVLQLRDRVMGVDPSVIFNYKWDGQDPTEGVKLSPNGLAYIVRSGEEVKASEVLNSEILIKAKLLGIKPDTLLRMVVEIPFARINGKYKEIKNAQYQRFLMLSDPLKRHIARRYRTDGDISVVKWWITHIEDENGRTIPVPFNVEPGLTMFRGNTNYVLRDTIYSGRRGDWFLYKPLIDRLAHGSRGIGGYNVKTGMNYVESEFNRDPRNVFVMYYENIPVYSIVPDDPESGTPVGKIFSDYDSFYLVDGDDFYVAIRQHIVADDINQNIEKLQADPYTYTLLKNWKVIYSKENPLSESTIAYPTAYSLRDHISNAPLGTAVRAISGDEHEELLRRVITEGRKLKIHVSGAKVTDDNVYKGVVTSGAWETLKNLAEEASAGVKYALAIFLSILFTALFFRLILPFFSFIRRKLNRIRIASTAGFDREANINTASDDGLRVKGYPKRVSTTIIQFRIKNGALVVKEDIQRLKSALINEYRPRSPPRKVIAKLNALERKAISQQKFDARASEWLDDFTSITQLSEILRRLGISEQDSNIIRDIVANWQREVGAIVGLNIDVNRKVKQALKTLLKYHIAGITDRDFLKKRFLSILQDKLFFTVKGEIKPEARKYLDNKVGQILLRLGLTPQSEDGRIARLKEAIVLQIAYSPFYELLWPDRQFISQNDAGRLTSPFLLTSATDNLTKYPLSEDEWKKFLEEIRQNRVRSLPIQGSILALERYVLMQVISLELDGLNSQGRLEEYIYKRINGDSSRGISADQRLSGWLTDDIQAKSIGPYIKAYYKIFGDIIREDMLALEDMRDRRGAVRGQKEGIRYHMFNFIWEEYNDALRYVLDDVDVVANEPGQRNTELNSKIQNLREEFNEKVDSILSGGFKTARNPDSVSNILLASRVHDKPFNASSIHYADNDKKELKNIMKTILLASNTYFELPREKHRMKLYGVYLYVFKHLLKHTWHWITSRGHNTKFNVHATYIWRRILLSLVFIGLAILFAYTGVNALMNWGFLSVPEMYTPSMTAFSLSGLLLYFGAWIWGCVRRNKQLNDSDKNADPTKSLGTHKAQLILQVSGLIIALVGLFYGAPLISGEIAIPEFLRTALKFVAYLVFFETFRFVPYALHYFIKFFATVFYWWKNDAYHLKPWKNSYEVAQQLHTVLISDRDTEKAVKFKDEFAAELEDINGNMDESYEFMITNSETKKLKDLIVRAVSGRISRHKFATEFAKTIRDDSLFTRGISSIFKWNLTRHRSVKLRIVRWINNKYRLDVPAQAIYARFLQPLDLVITAWKEDAWFDKDQLNRANKDKDQGAEEITSRLGMLALFKPELWEGLILRLKEEFRAQGMSEQRIRRDIKQLKQLRDEPDKELVLSNKAWRIVTYWANYHLPTGWANALTFTKARKLYTFRLMNLGYTRQQSQTKAEEMVRIIYRWGGGLREVEKETINAQSQGRVSSNLRKYINMREYKTNNVEDYINSVNTFKENHQQVVRLAAEKEVFLVWSRAAEEVGTGKYSHSMSVTPYLIGQTSLMLDADHHSRLEDI
ncbi:MAG: hypothetical protein NG712_04550, partial [Omnitrophica bacterium]|nr:hypothetical protein [Candidatus Omnitrophota bacterium]